MKSTLKMDKNCLLHTLSNGIRVVHKEVKHSKVAHCGFILDIGSRDELPDELGIAHFWEHMAFKGTNKRRAFHIINRLESVGGELNAYTTKEKICFYASFLDKHYEKAVELLSDITFDSIFPENQIERERHVILEEMAMYADAPEDAIQDELDALVFQNHPLGNNILGTQESIQTFQRDSFRNFIKRNLNTNRVIFSSVGNLDFSKVIKFAEKYFGQVPLQNQIQNRLLFQGHTPQQKRISKEGISQAYCALGRNGYPLSHQNRLPFALVVNLLGGPGLNSRLNLSLREKHGLVYSIEANYHSFTDTSLFSIYFATEEKYLEKSLKLIQIEFQKLQDKPLGVKQLQMAKEQILGQLAMAEESNLSFMLMMGKSLLDMNSIEPLETIIEKIQSLEAKKLQEITQEILSWKDFSQLIYLPKSEI